MKETVGVIGLGLMGKPMARNVLKAGFPVVVWNRSAGKAADLAAEGAQVASSPRALASRCTIVITMVTDAPDVEAVLLGPDGVASGARPGTVVVDMSTIAPGASRAIAARMKERGIPMLDAPVSGGTLGAINGTLSIMVGGDAAVLERCRPVLEAMGKRVVLCGGNGAGEIAKATNQIIGAITQAAVAEGLIFAAKAGADLEAVYQAVTGGAANSWQLENLGKRILNGDFAPGFTITNQVKDLGIVKKAAEEMGLPLYVLPLAHQFYKMAIEMGLGEEGTQAYIKTLEKVAGVEARR